MSKQSASSQRVRRPAANEPHIVGALAAELETLDRLADADIDTSDMPEVLDWSKAAVGKYYRPIKKQVSIRLDTDVLGWFVARDKKGYQTRINEALRQFVLAKTVAEKATPKRKNAASRTASGGKRTTSRATKRVRRSRG